MSYKPNLTEKELKEAQENIQPQAVRDVTTILKEHQEMIDKHSDAINKKNLENIVLIEKQSMDPSSFHFTTEIRNNDLYITIIWDGTEIVNPTNYNFFIVQLGINIHRKNETKKTYILASPMGWFTNNYYLTWFRYDDKTKDLFGFVQISNNSAVSFQSVVRILGDDWDLDSIEFPDLQNYWSFIKKN